MKRVILCGACGRMGREVLKLAFEADFWIIAGVDRKSGTIDSVPIYSSLGEIPKDVASTAELIIDFSSAEMTTDVLDFAVQGKLPLVMATTGHTSLQKEEIIAASSEIPVFSACNMSYAIGLFTAAVTMLAKELCSTMDTEIVEFHHRYKKDAPSGTALMLAEQIKTASGLPMNIVCGRSGKEALRGEYELGINSVRGGNIVGEHQVTFAGEDEVITLFHRVENRRSFAAGALKAAEFMVNAPAGLYDWETVLG